MNRRYRKTIIAGNWKMNKIPAETRKLIDGLKPLIAKAKWCDVVLCVPFVDIPAAVKAVKGTRIGVGAQNMHYEKAGAYTGEISAEMLTALGVKYVIIGHSERRQYFHETDQAVNKKVLAALEAGLRPIICVGETMEQRDQGITLDLIRIQVKIAVRGIEAKELKRVVFAYEPVWAIGTGRTATNAQANEVCEAIRVCLRELYGARAARSVAVQYGGSVNPKNAGGLFAEDDIDGALVGGASLNAEDFAKIVDAANR